MYSYFLKNEQEFYNKGFVKIKIIIFTGIYALRISQNPVRIPNAQPISDVIFDAPAFPDPISRISFFLNFIDMK